MSRKPKVTEKERDLLEHATGWRTREPLYRNFFAATPGSDDYLAWCLLMTRGLASTFDPANSEAIFPSLVHFRATPKGLRALDGRRKGRALSHD